MAFDLNNFVIDRIVRAVALSQTDDSVLFSINQVTNPSLNVTSETAEAVDALGVPVAIFNRAKSAEFSAENALFDMNLMAVQSGTAKQVAAADAVIVTPCFEEITIDGASASYTLAHTPIEPPAKIYKLNGDGTLGIAYELASSASETAFALNGAILNPPTGLVKDDQLFVIYEYEATGEDKNGAVSVVNSAKNFPVGCKLIVEVLGCDVCDQTKLIYAYLIFPNFKLSPDFDWTIATDSTHAFSGQAMQDYCDKDKTLYQLVIPE